MQGTSHVEVPELAGYQHLRFETNHVTFIIIEYSGVVGLELQHWEVDERSHEYDYSGNETFYKYKPLPTIKRRPYRRSADCFITFGRPPAGLGRVLAAIENGIGKGR